MIENEYRVFGPPGTGKTTYLTQTIKNTVEERGPNDIIISSFTKAAATELTGRDLPVNPANLGTLHALCYQQLGRPVIAESKIDEFNSIWPQYQVTNSNGKSAIDDLSDSQTGEDMPGDKLLAKTQVLRAQMVPHDQWPGPDKDFNQAWTEWKVDSGYMDYTDLIEETIRSHTGPPGNARVGFFDEAQDFTPLQLALVRQWGKEMDWYTLGADDDQLIYAHLGATPEALINAEIREEHIKFLTQSYRVPVKVQKAAQAWIEQVEVRQRKFYAPRDFEGQVSVISPASGIFAKYTVIEVLKKLEQDKSCMILATCNYMLQKTVKELRDRGIPFSNIYKLTNRLWNPLRPTGQRGSKTTLQRIRSYMVPTGQILHGKALNLPEDHSGHWSPNIGYWTVEELKTWAKLVKLSNFAPKGSTKKIDQLSSDLHKREPEMYDNILKEIFGLDNLRRMVQADLDWLLENATAASTKTMKFPVNILKRGGWEAVEQASKVTIGTIHSVKGAQADCIFLMPDLSPKQVSGWQSGEDKDAIIRQFYVGMTRAKEELIFLKPMKPNMALNFSRFIT